MTNEMQHSNTFITGMCSYQVSQHESFSKAKLLNLYQLFIKWNQTED